MEFLALDRLPSAPAQNVTVHVGRSAARVLRRGHPWLFDGAITKQKRDGEAGAVAVVFDDKRKMVGLGLYDPNGPIRVRMLTRRGGVPIDEEFFAERVRAAAQGRAGLPGQGTDGYRLIYGEGDGLPGLVVDRYASVLVVKLYSAVWFSRLRQLLPSLLEAQPAAHVVLRLSRSLKGLGAEIGLKDGQLIGGEPLPKDHSFREHGLRFEVDVLRGQKTGFFLDQRDNRRRIEKIAQGKKVLNVFSYSGGFSLYAARGGAKAVASLDASRPALDAAARNFVLNPELDCHHELICGDAFAELSALAKAGRSFDLIVIDPPSFARKKSEIPAAKRSYERLCAMGLALLEPGGTIVLASCSSRVPLDEFRALNEKAARRAGRPLTIESVHEHAVDHPVGFAEGAYLKALFCTA